MDRMSPDDVTAKSREAVNQMSTVLPKMDFVFCDQYESQELLCNTLTEFVWFESNPVGVKESVEQAQHNPFTK